MIRPCFISESNEVKIQDMFKTFLKHNHLTQKFLKNYNKTHSSHRIKTIDEYCQCFKISFTIFDMCDTFCFWCGTEEGYAFWDMVNKIWHVTYDYFQNKEIETSMLTGLNFYESEDVKLNQKYVLTSLTKTRETQKIIK